MNQTEHIHKWTVTMFVQNYLHLKKIIAIVIQL